MTSGLTPPKGDIPMATISHAIRIRAPRGRVYEALSTRDGVSGWNTPDLEGDVAQGREFTLRYGDGASFRWKVNKLDNGSAVSWEFGSGPRAAARSTGPPELSHLRARRTAAEPPHARPPDDHPAHPT